MPDDECTCGHLFADHDETWACTDEECNCALFEMVDEGPLVLRITQNE